MSCGCGHTHFVERQTRRNACGPYALYTALREINKTVPSETPHDMATQMGLTGPGWTGDTFGRYLAAFAETYKATKKEEFIGDVARARSSDEHPLIISCTGTTGGEPAGHWAVLSRANTAGDSFCILDSASGQCHTVAVPAGQGGSFRFTHVKANGATEAWSIAFEKGCYLIEPR
jgi:hypothetical protein